MPLVRRADSTDDTSLEKLSRREIARSIAVVAQENETSFHHGLRVRLAVVSARTRGRHWLGDTVDIEAAKTALSLCDLADFGDRFMNELVGR